MFTCLLYDKRNLHLSVISHCLDLQKNFFFVGVNDKYRLSKHDYISGHMYI